MPQTRPGHSKGLGEELAGRMRQDSSATGPAAVSGLTLRAGAAVTSVFQRGGFGGNSLEPAPGRPASDDTAPLSAAMRLDMDRACGILDAGPLRGDRAHGPGIHDIKARHVIAAQGVRPIPDSLGYAGTGAHAGCEPITCRQRAPRAALTILLLETL